MKIQRLKELLVFEIGWKDKECYTGMFSYNRNDGTEVEKASH